MVCYYCHHESQVYNTRPQLRTGFVWRRRRCTNCKATWSTLESPDWSTLWVVTDKNGQTGPFERDKLFLSIFESLKHRKHATRDATGLTEIILGKLGIANKHGGLSKNLIARTAGQTLNRFDKTAGAVYAAFHPVHE